MTNDAQRSIIDVHCHPFGNPACDLTEHIKVKRDAVLLRRKQPDLFAEQWGVLEDISDLLIHDMDERGVDVAVVQASVGEPADKVAEAVKKYPDRFIGLCSTGHYDFYPGTHPVLEKPDYVKLTEDIRYQVEELGFRGLGEVAVRLFSNESAPDRIAKDMIPLMEILNQHKIPVMLLTAWTQFGTPLYHGLPLYMDDLAESFPDVPIIVMKMGRGYDSFFEMALALATKHDNIYLETAQAPMAHIERAVREVGSSRVIFGTDWCSTWRQLAAPNNMFGLAVDALDKTDISKEDLDWILCKTAATLFKIDLSKMGRNAAS